MWLQHASKALMRNWSTANTRLHILDAPACVPPSYHNSCKRGGKLRYIAQRCEKVTVICMKVAIN